MCVFVYESINKYEAFRVLKTIIYSNMSGRFELRNMSESLFLYSRQGRDKNTVSSSYSLLESIFEGLSAEN